ncbi:MAG: 4Fe-4S binding protein, partial [candidate division KSB1 bacterium]|nr:4Fe-4S binding protein [candidate division KSB1 bacterium]
LLTPLLIIGGALAFSQFDAALARLHPRVALAAEVSAEEKGGAATPAVRAFRASGETQDELFADAAAIQDRARRGGMLLGGFLGLVLSLKLIGLVAPSFRREYEIDRGECLSCGRCFSYCPVDKDGNTLFPIESLGNDSNAGKSL